MEITEVRIYPVKLSGRLRAYASLTFDNSFIIREIKLIKSDIGMFVSMPSRRKKDGTFKDIAHPLNNTMREAIERKILEAYENAKIQGFPHTADEEISINGKNNETLVEEEIKE